MYRNVSQELRISGYESDLRRCEMLKILMYFYVHCGLCSPHALHAISLAYLFRNSFTQSLG
jgi:hypothetical protein